MNALRVNLTLWTALALLAGCGGSQPPIGAPGAMPVGRAIAQHAAHGESWMMPDAKDAKKLLYVSNEFYGSVYVYDFRTGVQLGVLGGFTGPRGQCVDKIGNVWITNDFDYAGQVVEYPHGGSRPLKVLPTYGPAIACAIDPRTGDLAVVNLAGPGSYGASTISIYQKGSDNYTNYTNEHCVYMGPAGYDSHGNLYVQGESGSWGGICELAVGATTLGTALTNVPGVGTGGIAWDGKYLVLEAQSQKNPSLAVLYRVVPKGMWHELTAVGKTVLHDEQCGGTTIFQPFVVGKRNTPANTQQGDEVVGSNIACGYRLDFWKYPRGTLTRWLTDAPRNPYGASVSIRE